MTVPCTELKTLTQIESDRMFSLEGNLMLEDKEQMIYARTPTPKNSEVAGANSVLTRRKVSNGLKSLHRNTERTHREAGDHVPIEAGNLCKRTPCDMSNELVSPCGMTDSQDHEDAQQVQRIQPNSTIGLILSVRGDEIESFYGLNISVAQQIQM